jgi:hypothetical protein
LSVAMEKRKRCALSLAMCAETAYRGGA